MTPYSSLPLVHTHVLGVECLCQSDRQLAISLYLMEATTLRHSKNLVGLKHFEVRLVALTF